MELLIQGRKDGYNVLFPHPTPSVFFRFASDIQSLSASSDSRFLGKSFFSIAFADGGCILSKYIVGFDYARGAVGNIGFSIFVPKEKRLPGFSARELLDGLIEGYRANYLQNNVIPSSKVENWAIFSNLANMYDSKLVVPEDVESFEPGTAVPAYYYYASIDELEKILDAPYQNEFKGFKQVFLLDGSYDGTADNPLLCQKFDINANLTGKVDFRNIKLRISFDDRRDSDIQIIIEETGQSARLFNNSRVRLHDSVRITWNKSFYEKKVLEGRLSDIAEREPGLVSLDEDRRIVTISPSVRLVPQKKHLQVLATSATNNSILTGATITATHTYSQLQKTAVGGIIIFEGDEMGQSWLISAKSGMLSSDDKNEANTIVPSRIEKLQIRLHEDFILTVKGVDETGHDVCEIYIELPGNGIPPQFTQSNNRKFTFRDAQINRPVEIVASKKFKDGTRLEGRQTVIPGGQDVVEIVMRKVNPVSNVSKPFFRPQYRIDAGKHGYKVQGCPNKTLDPRGEDVKQYIKADFGYEFDRFDVIRDDDVIIAVYKKKLWARLLPLILAVVTSAAIGIGIGFYLRDFREKSDFQQESFRQEANSRNDESTTSKSDADTTENVASSKKKRLGEGVADDSKCSGTRYDSGRGTSSETQSPTSESTCTSSEHLSQATAPESIDEEILRFLKSDELTKIKLSDYRMKANDESIKNSIGIVDEFWKIVEEEISRKDEMDGLLKKVKSDSNLVDSDLASFIKDILRDSATFEKFNAIQNKTSITTLEELKTEFDKSV